MYGREARRSATRPGHADVVLDRAVSRLVYDLIPGDFDTRGMHIRQLHELDKRSRRARFISASTIAVAAVYVERLVIANGDPASAAASDQDAGGILDRVVFNRERRWAGVH